MFQSPFFLILIVVLASLSSCKKDETLSNSPTTAGQWIQTSFSNSGNVLALAANGTSVLVATSTGGFAQTTDNGTTWTALTGAPVNNDFPMSLVLDGSNIIVGTLFSIYLSSDGGQTWEPRRTGISGTGLYTARFLVNGSSLFAATYPGVYVSTNSGESWAVANGGLIGQINAFAVSGSNLFASNDSGVFRSTNNGGNWTRTSLTNRIYSIAILGTNLFAAIRDAPGGVLRSTDNGGNWVPVNNGLANANAVHTLFVHGNVVFAGAVLGVYYTTDNGATWVAFNEGFTNQATNVAEFAVSGTTLYVGIQGGPGAVWKRTLPGY